MTLSKQDITTIAQSIGADYASFMAFIMTESGGKGFDTTTGKIIIQFEPTWFHRYLTQYGVPHTFSAQVATDGSKRYKIATQTQTLVNGVQGQAAEWEAFNVAFAIHPTSALLSTSIGLMQVMGFNYKALGYATVNAMWDDFKKGEYAQVKGAAAFIKSVPALHKALLARDWAKVAYYYNGENYAVNGYDKKLLRNFTLYATSS